MIDKLNYSLEAGVGWAITAINYLKNVYGFSPNQLVFKKKKFPNDKSSKLPALEGVICIEIVPENLSLMYHVRQAFPKPESDGKLRRALRLMCYLR